MTVFAHLLDMEYVEIADEMADIDEVGAPWSDNGTGPVSLPHIEEWTAIHEEFQSD